MDKSGRTESRGRKMIYNTDCLEILKAIPNNTIGKNLTGIVS